MTEFKDYIHSEYKFLYEQGFIDKDAADDGKLFSMLSAHNESLGLIFSFVLEKGLISVSISTQKIMSEKKYSKYEKYFDFFYVVKLLYPEKKFSDINPSLYPQIIQDNWDKLISLFNSQHIDRTSAALNLIIEEYNKIRWKK